MTVISSQLSTPTRLRGRRAGLESAVRRELPQGCRYVDLSRFDEQSLADEASSLHRLRTACGCRVGEVGVLVMLLAAMLDVALVRRPHTTVGAVVALIEIAVAVVIGGLVGKGVGVLAARTRYVLRTRRLDAGSASRYSA